LFLAVHLMLSLSTFLVVAHEALIAHDVGGDDGG
jgi:hypothetical protein